MKNVSGSLFYAQSNPATNALQCEISISHKILERAGCTPYSDYGVKRLRPLQKLVIGSWQWTAVAVNPVLDMRDIVYTVISRRAR